MLKLILKYLFNIMLLVFSLPLMGQETSEKYTSPLDSAVKHQGKLSPTGIRIGIDVLSIGLSLADEKKIKYEAMLDIDFHTYFLVLEAGYQSFEDNQIAEYSGSGTYYRIGPDVNFLASSKNLDVFFFGLRFSQAMYEEQVTGSIDGGNWGIIPVSVDQQSKTSTWIEMTSGMKVRLWRQLFAGYTLRFRFSRFGDDPDNELIPYYIPGFGLADRKNTWFFNYYLFYRIQWKKKLIYYKD